MYRHIDVPGYGAPFWMGLGEEVDMSGETRPDVVRTGLGEPPELGEVLDQDSDLLPIVQAGARRSEEHTSELQSLMRISYAVFCLKKKKNYYTINPKTKT